MTDHLSDHLPDPLPSALRDELATRADGAALGAVWRSLPTLDAQPADASATARREAAWQRVAAKIRDTTREPASDGLDSPMVLLLDDEGEAPVSVRAGDARVAALPRVRQTGMHRWWRVAAAVTILLGGAAVWQSVPERIAVAAGATPSTITLADGSRVTLAPGAELRVARGFRNAFGGRISDRTVALSGEAFFDVARDGRSFEVITSDAVVRVLGTHFDVRSATVASGTRVMVEEGRVAVQGRAGTSPAVTLAGGDAAVVGARGLVERRVVANVTRATNWRTGGLSAVNEPLGDVLAELARRSGVEISLDRGVDATAMVTFFYADAPSLERVLADIGAAQSLRYTRTSRGFRIASAPSAS